MKDFAINIFVVTVSVFVLFASGCNNSNGHLQEGQLAKKISKETNLSSKRNNDNDYDGKADTISSVKRDINLATMPYADTSRLIKPPFTLEECIQLALSNNPDIGISQFNISSAQAQQQIAEGERWPVIKLQGAYKHHFDDQRLIQPRYPGEPGVWDNDILSGDIVFKMPLFTGGRITNEIKASKLLKESAEYQLGRTRRELIFNVSSVFYKILAEKKIIEALKFSQETLRKHRKRIKDMVEVQRATKVDLLRISVRLADINQRIVMEQNRLSILRRVLANLLGRNKDIKNLRIKGELKLTDVNPDLDMSINRAYLERMDYLSMQKKIDAQRYRVKVAQAGHWPIISFEASYGFRSALNPSTRPSTEEQTEDVGFFGVTADWPVFEGGRIDARIRKERAKLDLMQEQLRKLKLKIRLDVETAILNIRSTRERVKAIEASIAQAKESLRIEREKYAEGKGTITDVLDAQEELINAQSSYYSALSNYNVAVAQWRFAIGVEK